MLAILLARLPTLEIRYMAGKSNEGINLSEKIRQYLKDHKRAKPKQVVEAFAKEGITIKATFVSTVKTNAKKRKKKRGGTRAGAAAASDSVSLATLVQAKRLAEQLGGVPQAKAALDALARLQ